MEQKPVLVFIKIATQKSALDQPIALILRKFPAWLPRSAAAETTAKVMHIDKSLYMNYLDEAKKIRELQLFNIVSRQVKNRRKEIEHLE